MSSPNTRIAEIVDATASIVLSEIPAVASARGVGSGLVADPRRTGKLIEPAHSGPIEPFQHVSDMPETGDLPLNAMQGTHVITWTIPMRLFVSKGDLSETRRVLAPMFAAYLAAFSQHVTLLGTARRWSRLTYRVASDDNWAWLEMRLTVDERLNLATEA